MGKDIDIEKFSSLNVELEYKKIIDKYAEKAIHKLENTNAFKTKPRKNSKPYKTTWTKKIEESKDYGYEVIVYNKDNWQLTHLLEKGHFIVNKKGGVGWASEHPHIEPTYSSLVTPFKKDMQDVNIKLKIK